MNRDKIILSYRDRIAHGARTRLSTAELEELIQAFIDQLQTLNDRSAIDQLCQTEIALLEEGYPLATVAKNYIPKYRKAILAATEAGVLPLSETTRLDYNYSKRNGEVVHFYGHYAYTAMKYTDEYTNIAEQDNARNNLKQDNLKPVNLVRYLEEVRKLLASADHNDLAVAIAAVTGRRFSEVVLNRFSKTAAPYTLRFAGQLKKREDSEPYLTLCLIPAAEVWTAIQRFRKLERIQDLQALSTQAINARMNKSVQRVAHRHFGESGIVPNLESESTTTIHNLRAVYAIASIHLFCPPSQGEHRFLQEQLGHVIGQRNLQLLKNSPSTAHYFHYYLTDDNGKHLGTKGVLLDSTAAIESLPAAQTLIELKHPPSVPFPAPMTKPTSETLLMDALSELSHTIGFLRREAEQQTQRADALQAERDRLALDLASLRQRLTDLEQATHEQAGQTEPLRQQIASLQAENAAYKAKLDAFGRLLANANSNPFPSGAAAQSAPASLPASPRQPSSPMVSHATPETMALTQASAPSPLTSKPKPGRRSAKGKLEAAVKFLQERNQQVDHAHMWAITQSIIGSLTGSNISLTVKPFWKEIEDVMDKYNGDRAMDERRHNYGRSDQIPRLKEEFETWLDAQLHEP